MLAGLLFAIEEAADAPGRLAATLPFAGTTLIEYQARQLVAAGATQIVVIGARATPELLGALHRTGRRAVAVDAVRSVAEAAAKLHPLARVAMVADGLVAADAVVAEVANEAEETLLVVAGGEAPPLFERIGGGEAWAGVARIDPRRLADVAAMPADYDPQSTLLHVVDAASGVRHRRLAPEALAAGHGIEREAASLDRLGRTVIAGMIGARRGWFDRFVAGPVAAWLMPPLIGSGVSAATVAGAAGGVAVLSVVALAVGWARPGMLLALAATLAFTLAITVAIIREERRVATASRIAMVAMPLVALLLLGRAVAAGAADSAGLTVALAAVVAALLGERAARRPRSWWGTPPAYLVLATLATLPGWPLLGLVLVACYAVATLAAAIEDLRRDA